MRWTVGYETGDKAYYYNLGVEDLSPLPFNLPPTSDLLLLNFDTVGMLAIL